MPKLGQLEAHLIRRVPELEKNLEMEKERLERVGRMLACQVG